jgi:hypothetical protein
MQTDCSMRSLDMCRQEVIAGNHFFSPNPCWQSNPAASARTRFAAIAMVY